MDNNATLDERQQRGLVIAATSKIVKRGNETWIVPSQSLNGKYAVTMAAEGKECTCPDFELRQQPCKHIFAVQYVLFRESVTETKPDGTVTTTTTEAASVRVTYGQPNWNAYNEAQTTEKDHFCRLLRDLVADVPTPEQKGAGNRRLAMSDLLFGMAYKVYSGFSSRRFMSDLRAAREAGFVEHAASFNALIEGMQLEEVTPILHDLIKASAKPLASVETQFAVDSTGMGTQCFYRHYSAKYGHDQNSRDYVKIHAMIGTKTNVITAAEITDRNGGDAPQFPGLVERTAEDFNIEEASADKAYSTVANLAAVEAIGAVPYIPFKSNSKPAPKKASRRSAMWARLSHYFQMNREEFLEHYHRRSNVECTFSMMKRVIGDTLRSKHPVAQVNEALLMVLCHNIRCLIHEMVELGVTPMLETTCTPITEVARQLPTR